MTDDTNVISAPIRVVIIDDHPVIAAGARSLIETSHDIVYVGEAYTGQSGLELIERTDPDVVVLDLTLPDMSGLTLAKKLTSEGVRSHIVMMTMLEDRSYIQQALQAGAKGFIQKRSAGQNLLLAIRSAMLGGLFLDPPTAHEIGTGDSNGAKEDAHTSSVGLTAREENVLRMVSLGYSNKEIAYHIDVSIKSVETYKARATEKLNLHSRAQIVRFAVEHGWMTGDHPDSLQQ